MHCHRRANPPAWIIAKHRIQSTLLSPRISLLLKVFLPKKTHLCQTGTSLESYLLCAMISNYHSLERWQRLWVLPRSEKWVGGCRSHAYVWALAMLTVPTILLLRHESQAHASSAAMLTLEEDKRKRGGGLPRHLAWLSIERWRFTLGCDQMLLQPTDQQANGKP